MYYSAIGAISILITLIVNYDFLSNKHRDHNARAYGKYRNFLICALCYYATDAIWGVLNDNAHILAIYTDTVFYFLTMALSVFLWTRYVVEYLGDETAFGRIIRGAGWVFLVFELSVVFVNFFKPILFYFDDSGNYQAADARYITLGLQILLYFITSAYTMKVAVTTTDRSSMLRYRAVWLFGLVMVLMISVQMMYPLMPFYAAGYLISTSLIHTFVHENEHEEHRSALRKMLEREKEHTYLVRDQLTGMPDMSSFLRMAGEYEESLNSKGRRPVMVYINLTGMKLYNMKSGFKRGDELLKSLARLLERKFGSYNCCRLGADQFAAFTDEATHRKTLTELVDEWDRGRDEITPPIRIGVYTKRPEEIDASAACDRAKYACDYRKNMHGSYISYFDDEMLTAINNRRYILDNFDRALREKWIEVYYQPIIRSVNGRVCDEEALARWLDPTYGMLPPDLFIPILESEGVIYKLDLYVVEQVLAKMNKMRDLGFHLVPQSVNLSRVDFEACNVIDEITRRVDAAGIDHRLITIEITESVVARDLDYMKEQVDRFRELGFPVWMDDFGSGYSSLDVLQHINFDLIKLDMQFMRNFDDGNRSKVIITEVMKMAYALGVDTVCEGVEREDQVEFLREVGCSRIQGYYYTKPLPLDEVIKRYEEGLQIGFEDSGETGYFNLISSINLYDLSVFSESEERDAGHYFSTLPMSVIEIKENKSRFIRNNKSFREFMKHSLDFELGGMYTEIDSMPAGKARGFMEAIEGYCGEENFVFVDERLPGNLTVHSLIRRVAENPHTGTSAYVIVILAIAESENDATYENIARSLASDYFDLFYVNLETEEFIEYRSTVGKNEISAERHGDDFFESAKHAAISSIYEADLNAFVNAFTKESIIKALDEQGSFNLDYRLLIDGEPAYVSMKAARMESDDNHIIIGISNVDAQTKEKKTLEKLRNERAAYNRIKAILGDFIVMYSINPDNDHYYETSANADYEHLGIAKEGDDFFHDSYVNSESTVYHEDLPFFRKMMTKENILRTIDEEGLFVIKYRLVINEEIRLVKLRGAMLDESDGMRLIIGINYIVD